MLTKLRSLGPGLLYAGAAIGVSHIVQSTKAGANYGFILIIAIILAHFFKYPFFALGPRYANKANETLIQGFKKVGSWALILVFILTFATMFSVQAAVTVVTGGLAELLTGIDLAAWQWSAILLVICFLILAIGKFSVLDNLMKVIMVILALSTVAAFAFSFGIEPPTQESMKKIFNLTNPNDIEFLIAFVGWMPAPLEIAIWHSIWTMSKYADRGRNDLKAENFDFKVGFYGTAFLAICFLSLGANTIYGTDIELKNAAGAYAAQLVDIYTTSLGAWSYPIIIVAAFTTMFSTTLTCFDAMPRVMREIMKEWAPNNRFIQSRLTWMSILAIGAIIILARFIENMQEMVMIATIVSFLTAPFLAFVAYRLVQKNKEKKLWTKNEMGLAMAGLVFLILLSIIYIYTLL